jgi:hypothetical protein
MGFFLNRYVSCFVVLWTIDISKADQCFLEVVIQKLIALVSIFSPVSIAMEATADCNPRGHPLLFFKEYFRQFVEKASMAWPSIRLVVFEIMTNVFIWVAIQLQRNCFIYPTEQDRPSIVSFLRYIPSDFNTCSVFMDLVFLIVHPGSISEIGRVYSGELS